MAGYTLKMLSGGSSVQGIGYLNAAASTPNRGALGAFAFGFTTVASAAFTWVVQDCNTTSLTGTSRTPTPDDPADAATNFVAKDTITADGTLTANSFRMYWPMYQNNSARWAATSDRQRKFIAASANAGFMFGLSAATTTVGAGSVDFDQL